MKIIPYLVGAALVGLLSRAAGWADSFHYVIGSITLVVFAAVCVVLKKIRGDESDDAGAEEYSPLRQIILGVVGAAFVSLLLWSAFASTRRIERVASLFYDVDRAQFEEEIRHVTAAGNPARAVDLIQARLGRGMSADWRTALSASLYTNLIGVANAAPSFEQITNALHSAMDIARTNHFDGSLAQSLLKQQSARAKTRAKLERLKTERNWPALIHALEFAMTDRPRAEWELPFDRWLYEAYLAWSLVGNDPRHRSEKLDAARGVASQFNLDPALVQARFDELRANQESEEMARVAREKALAQGNAEANRLRAEVDTAKAESERVKLAATRAQEEAQRELKRTAAQAELDGLLQAGDALQEGEPQRTLERRQDIYRRALNFAESHGLDSSAVNARLRQIVQDLAVIQSKLDAEQAKLRPADLLPGTRAGITRITTDNFPPVFGLELYVEDRQGNPVAGLSAKDFQITCQGKVPKNVAFAAIKNEAPRLSVVLAFDTSGSMRPAMSEAINAGQGLLRGLANNSAISFKVLKFSGDVRAVCDWTSDAKQAAASLSVLRPESETALFDAIAQGCEELESQSGDRRLVLFTDGRNTVRSANNDITRLVERLQRGRVVVTTIGLRNADLDTNTLQNLAGATGGNYFVAASAADLGSKFNAALQGLRRTLHRFVVTPESISQATTFPVSIRIGGANAVVLEDSIPLPSFAARK